MGQRYAYALNINNQLRADSRGQALLEAPITILVLLIIFFGLYSLGIWARTNFGLSAVASSICRVATTGDMNAQPYGGVLIRAYAIDCLRSIGAPLDLNTVDVAITGDAHADIISVKVSAQPRLFVNTHLAVPGVKALTTMSATFQSRGSLAHSKTGLVDTPSRFGRGYQ